MPSPKKAPSKVVAVNSAETAAIEHKPVQSVSSPATISVLSRSADIEERIRRRAYDFYEQRGYVDGFAEEDWLRAEAEVLSHRRSA